ncbi:unnamed protein product [Rotaria socialis]|uniref:Uncharacterized protein n=1 Tax=Rotaria socialis TaxID=392032 RepID=A0A818CVU8_9BILA|nr:unnamed protein product [Rotaria socialis]CAF3432274.1 unnamed protein product [Rotaria socialis]CAF3539407.1 unnamed protein product [Rotaria socialis]CAF4574161.1 unnamed protein product [Rotaria socialis]CAF4615953.1 unnamed protein product [Rotaria socialis]
MVALSNKNIVLIVFASSLFVLQINAEQEHDDMCRLVRDVLCVKDVLMIIAMTTRSMERTINKTQVDIAGRIGNNDTANRYVKYQVGNIDSQLPTPKYHTHFFQLNNINKKYLVHLFSEAHDAMSFYYNTIQDILNVSDTSSTNDLKDIQNILNKMICQYRSVLHVYLHGWTTIDRIKSVEFSKISSHISQTFLNDAHSMIIIDILRTWMDKIHSVIHNIEAKYF